jgi:putative CocE/NonD family hydrolase
MKRSSEVRAARLAIPMICLFAACTESGPEGPDEFDVYLAGVPTMRLVSDDGPGVGVPDRSYRVELRDPRTAQWSEPRVVPAGEIASGAASTAIGFALPLPAILADTRAWVEEWPGGFIWPGTVTRYEPHRELRAQVAGRGTDAVYWAAEDASFPTDLVLAPDGRLLASVIPSTDLVLVRRGYEEFTTVGRWRDPGVSQAEYGFTEIEERVPMSDGVNLATLVYLPVGDIEGPFPTVFIRTPYGISGLVGQYFHYPARGFALVLQATRGTSYGDPEQRSEGEWDPMVMEPADGADALSWIAEQPWSDGSVCMQGGSYVGYTQWAASMANDPALRCTVPESSMGTAFTDQPFMGGGFVEGLAYYMFWMLDRRILPDRSWTEILHHRPISDMDVFATGEDIRQWNEVVENWRNNAFWKRQDWYAGEGERPFGSLQISGWWDDDYPGTQSNWELMQQRSSAPQHLVVGPWKHGYNADRSLNGFSFGADALRDDIWLLKQKWYDHFLKGADNGVAGTVVDYFVLGDNEWRRADRWPPTEAVEERWYFQGDGSAATSGGSLSMTPPDVDQPPDTYVYDPADPPSNWTDFDGMTRWEDIQSFPADFAEMEARSDVAVYTSEPLAEDVTIAGPIVVELHGSTDVLDTDWWAHVSDVHPDGRSVRLSTGLIRARFRGLDDPVYRISGSNFEAEELLSGDPADVVRYEIGLPAVANTFRAGHRIRVAVMNALDNYSFPNSNTGGHEAHVTTTRPGTMGIHHSPGRASHVRFFVLPR